MIKKLSFSAKDGVREWEVWLRAPTRRVAGNDRSKFLRDERDMDWVANQGSSNFDQRFSRESGTQILNPVVIGHCQFECEFGY